MRKYFIIILHRFSLADVLSLIHYMEIDHKIRQNKHQNYYPDSRDPDGQRDSSYESVSDHSRGLEQQN